MSPQEIRAAVADFPHAVELIEDSEGIYRLGFIHEGEGMAIHDIRESSCGRFEGTPEMYGVSQAQFDAFDALAAGIEKSAEKSLNAMALEVQSLFGVDSGDVAGVHFSGGSALQTIRKMLITYLVAEINMNFSPSRPQPGESSQLPAAASSPHP
ncbi:hypothetical protein [Polaromonas sp.]|uniref:hypothetical protein n=1 Tax=Polaromonas sp. TaxID=1869339 RepID=UPI00352A886D